MGHHDRKRHQFLGFGARVSEHQALVSGPARINPHRDVGRLAVEGRQHRAGVGVKTELCTGVADISNGLSRDLRKVT